MENLLVLFFRPPTTRGERRFFALLSIALYLLGALHWCLFLNWGRIPYELHDWKQSGSFFLFLRQAALTNQLPLQTNAQFVRTERYLAMPNAPFSPQEYLLRFLDIGPFMVVNLLLLFSLGFLGLILFQRRYSLSPLTFVVFFLLFNFNGHITAHLAVGHVEWVGYFLLPFLVLLVMDLVDGTAAGPGQSPGGLWGRVRCGLSWMFCGREGWQWSLWLALVFLGLFLQGAFHFALWCAIFLLVFGLTRRESLPLLARGLFFGVLLSALRVVPAAIQFYGGGVEFISGFPTLTDFLSALVVLKSPAQSQAWAWESLGWWEVDTFVGLPGLAFLFWFGIVHAWRTGGKRRHVLVPILVITFLSIGNVYRIVTLLPLPLLDSERVTSRFFIVALVFLLALASREFEEWLQRRSRPTSGEALFALAMTALLAHDLFQHSRLWRVAKMYDVFSSEPADLTSQVIHYSDPPYHAALLIGAGLTMAALIFLVVQARREKGKRPAARRV